MVEAFREGGWGMFPVLACGVALLVAAVRFAIRADVRSRAVMDGFERALVAFGIAGTVTGLVATGSFVSSGEVADPVFARVLVAGVKESLQNVALASVCVAVARLVAVVGRGRAAVQ